nr:RNase adapter RapZ [Microbacterium flavescens]
MRGGRLFSEAQTAVRTLRESMPSKVRVLFLDATDAVLVRRFEQVRRPHPLQGDGTLLDGILAERARMEELRETSDVIVDTSELNIHQLATSITETFAESERPGVQVTVLSFGFKYGLPTDADMVGDARFLPNPFWVPELRAQNGLDEPVTSYVMAQQGARRFIEAFGAALEPVLEGYQRENKRHATIAIGCTGGKHRSVTLVGELAAHLRELRGVAVSVKHRDLGRE